MVRTWIVHVDLPEPSHRVRDLLRFPLEKAQLKSRNHPLDLVLEHDLGARKKADRHLRFPDGRKPTGRRIPKFRRDEFVSDLRRSRCSSVQTVVAHGRGAPMVAVPRLPIPPVIKKVMTKSGARRTKHTQPPADRVRTALHSGKPRRLARGFTFHNTASPRARLTSRRNVNAAVACL